MGMHTAYPLLGHQHQIHSNSEELLTNAGGWGRSPRMHRHLRAPPKRCPSYSLYLGEAN